jgi:hypothetical protein
MNEYSRVPFLRREELIEAVGKLGKIVDYLVAYNRQLKYGPARATIEVERVEKK